VRYYLAISLPLAIDAVLLAIFSLANIDEISHISAYFFAASFSAIWALLAISWCFYFWAILAIDAIDYTAYIFLSFRLIAITPIWYAMISPLADISRQITTLF